MQIDSIHFYVTDARNTSNWLINCLDFQLVDLVRDDNFLTVAIAKGAIFFIFSSPLKTSGVVAHYLDSHAEGIVDLSFRVHNLNSISDRANYYSIKVLQNIQQEGLIRYNCLAGWQDLQHTLIEATSPSNCYRLPNGKIRSFQANYKLPKDTLTFKTIDHIVLNVAQKKLSQAVTYYQNLFNFKIQQTFKIKTERSGLYSQALIDTTGSIQFNINEPTTDNSQIQEFIELNGGAGIQHLALRSSNLIQDVAKMQLLGVPFLPIPSAYYTHLRQRLNRNLIQLSVTELQSITERAILVDWHQHKPKSLLMQIFTRPLLEKPTFFLEFIERRQKAIGFGEGNFQALFAAVEQSTIENEKSIIDN